jgi:type II secretory pathway component PulF
MLVESLAKLSTDLKRLHELKQKVKASLMYPFIIFIFLVLAIVVVLSYVIPALTPLFATADVELPLATRSLIATSDFLLNNYWYIILFIFGGAIALFSFKSTKEGKNKLSNFMLATPLI